MPREANTRHDSHHAPAWLDNGALLTSDVTGENLYQVE